MLKINEIKSFHTFIFCIFWSQWQTLSNGCSTVYLYIFLFANTCTEATDHDRHPPTDLNCSACFGFCQPEQLFSLLPRTFKEPHCSPSGYQPNKQQTVKLFPPSLQSRSQDAAPIVIWGWVMCCFTAEGWKRQTVLGISLHNRRQNVPTNAAHTRAY